MEEKEIRFSEAVQLVEDTEQTVEKEGDDETDVIPSTF